MVTSRDTTWELNKQSFEFGARVLQSLPKGMPRHVMQGWIDNPRALREQLRCLVPTMVLTGDEELREPGVLTQPASSRKDVEEKKGRGAVDPHMLAQAWELPFFRMPSEWLWEFAIAIPANGTKLEIEIGTRFPATLGLELLTLDCPPLYKGRHKSHQRLTSLGFGDIVGVTYHFKDHFVDFDLKTLPGENGKSIRILSTGYFWANMK